MIYRLLTPLWSIVSESLFSQLVGKTATCICNFLPDMLTPMMLRVAYCYSHRSRPNGASRKQVRVTKTPFYIVKLGFTGVYFFLILLQNIDCGYSLEPPH